MTETNDTTSQMNNNINTNRIKVDFRTTDKINMLLKQLERSDGVRNDSSRRLLFIGVGYILWGLKSEFGGDFDNETKFETDFKTETIKFPKLTPTYFNHGEIDRLRLIDETIKKCYRNHTTYRDTKQYVGMCSYLEFLENDNPSLRFENNTTTDKNTQTDFGDLQFEQNSLQVIHGHFNSDGKLWESIDVNEFYNNFKKVPAKTLKLKNVEGFCFLMGLHEDTKIDISNINHWFKDHFPAITNYSKQKAKKEIDAKKTKNKLIQEYITNKLQPMKL